MSESVFDGSLKLADNKAKEERNMEISSEKSPKKSESNHPAPAPQNESPPKKQQSSGKNLLQSYK
jgi:hypothetical protein